MTLRMAVMVKVVPKPEEVTLDEASMTIDRDDADSQLNPADKNALELALTIKDDLDAQADAGAGEGEDDGPAAEVVVLSMGPPFVEEYLQDCIAMGADDAVLLSDRAFAGADTYPTSRVLAAGVEALGGVDVVFCGEESSDSSTGQVPPGIAEWLHAAQVTYVSDASVADGSLTATRSVSGGHETVRVPLPAVVSVEYGVNDPRFPDFKRKRWAKTEWELTVWDSDDLDVPEEVLGHDGSFTEVVRLETVEAPDRKREAVEGPPAEQAARLADVVRDALP